MSRNLLVKACCFPVVALKPSLAHNITSVKVVIVDQWSDYNFSLK